MVCGVDVEGVCFLTLRVSIGFKLNGCLERESNKRSNELDDWPASFSAKQILAGVVILIALMTKFDLRPLGACAKHVAASGSLGDVHHN